MVLHKNLLVKKNTMEVVSKLWQRHLLPNITGVTPERILILPDVHCALTVLFKMLTFVIISLTKICMHTHNLNCNRTSHMNVIYRNLPCECNIQDHVCFKAHYCHIIVHSVAYIFKRETVIPTILLKALTIIFYIFSKKEY